jgi:steroid delta-isomerase-like uncharacterized protein
LRCRCVRRNLAIHSAAEVRHSGEIAPDAALELTPVRPERELDMDHSATVRSLYELINAGDIGGFADHLSDDFVEHEQTPGLQPTKEGVKQFFRMQIAAFPDMHLAVEDVFESGPKVVARVRYRGTNTAEFMGTPATGKKVDVQLIDMFLFGADGRVHEHWGVIDALAMMQQLGLVPQGTPA